MLDGWDVHSYMVIPSLRGWATVDLGTSISLVKLTDFFSAVSFCNTLADMQAAARYPPN